MSFEQSTNVVKVHQSRAIGSNKRCVALDGLENCGWLRWSNSTSSEFFKTSEVWAVWAHHLVYAKVIGMWSWCIDPYIDMIDQAVKEVRPEEGHPLMDHSLELVVGCTAPEAVQRTWLKPDPGEVASQTLRACKEDLRICKI